MIIQLSGLSEVLKYLAQNESINSAVMIIKTIFLRSLLGYLVSCVKFPFGGEIPNYFLLGGGGENISSLKSTRPIKLVILRLSLGCTSESNMKDLDIHVSSVITKLPKPGC